MSPEARKKQQQYTGQINCVLLSDGILYSSENDRIIAASNVNEFYKVEGNKLDKLFICRYSIYIPFTKLNLYLEIKTAITLEIWAVM